MIDPNRDVALLQLENTGAGKEDKVMCQMMWNEMPGGFLAWVSGEKHTYQFMVWVIWSNVICSILSLQPQGKREISIPLNTVAPCLCFQVTDISVQKKGNLHIYVENKSKPLFPGLVERKGATERNLPFQKPTRWKNIYKCGADNLRLASGQDKAVERMISLHSNVGFFLFVCF